tara:strand:- start:90 stop:452 length:363 start_codon:yes stop_codon:yes gene_type:complete
MLMMNTNSISKELFLNPAKSQVKSRQIILRRSRKEIIRIGQTSQNKREETITIHGNQLLAVHAQGMEKDVLETVEGALETIEGVLEEINETIDDSDQDLISGTSAFSMAIRWEHGCNFFQ